MRKLLLIGTFLIPTVALAGSSTISVTPGTGATYAVGTNGATNFFSLTGICDGSAAANCMAVKAASTAPVATDPAAVVAISPNSPMVGTAGTAGTSVFSVQGIASMTPLLATVSQATAANLNATVVGTGTFAVQLNTTPTLANGNGVVPTQSGIAISAANPSFSAISIGGSVNASGNPIFVQNTTGSALMGKVGIDQTTPGTTNAVSLSQVNGNAAIAAGAGILKVGIVGNNAAVFDFAGQNAASPANSILMGGQFQTSPTTITPGNASPLQLDNAGNLLVNIKAGAGSGGTALGDNAAWTAGTTNFTPSGCEFTTGGATAITTTHAATVGCTSRREQFADIEAVGGTASLTTYGSTPGSVPALPVNAFVTNTNANGQATAANSSPVVLPAAQVTADPCSLNTKVNFTISTTAGTLQLVAPSGSTQVYICSLFTVGATASIQNIVGGTGSTCTTGTPVAIAGSTTAANGMSFAANGGFTFGNGGGTILRTTTAGHGVCLIQSATAQISGGGTYVQQ